MRNSHSTATNLEQASEKEIKDKADKEVAKAKSKRIKEKKKKRASLEGVSIAQRIEEETEEPSIVTLVKDMEEALTPPLVETLEEGTTLEDTFLLEKAHAGRGFNRSGRGPSQEQFYQNHFPVSQKTRVTPAHLKPTKAVVIMTGIHMSPKTTTTLITKKVLGITDTDIQRLIASLLLLMSSNMMIQWNQYS